ncbi:MAG: hemolysin family protein [Oscillospiraceae bacterium]|jgi:putative hemolysin|nr:hemolysin family protein [Oscillospiraceae bacterium]
MTNIIFKLLILVLLILCNAFFAMSEIAIITLNDNKIRKMADSGHKKAKRILALTQDSSSFLATIQVGVTLAGFLSSASAAQSFSSYLESGFAAILPNVPAAVINTISTVIITMLLSYFSLVFGELIPKKLGMQRPENISFRVIGILSFANKVLWPFVRLLSFSTNSVIRLFGINPHDSEKTVTEEEILMLVDVGGQKGIIEENEREMIANIFEFGDTTVSEVMTHRTEVSAIEDTQSIAEIIQIAQEEGYSRMPLFHDDIDTVLGIIYVKDLLKYVGDHLPKGLKAIDIMRPAYFIPEFKRLSQLFSEMTEKKISMAIVVDEYGGTSGIITMEDLLESIVGNIQDEFDDEEEEISRLSENCFTVEGSTLLDEINDELDTNLPKGDYDTIGGFVVSLLGRIPEESERPSIELGDLTLTVEQVEEQRIAKVLITKNPIEVPVEVPKKQKILK